MKNILPSLWIRKGLYSLLLAMLTGIMVTWNTGNQFHYGFFPTYAFCLFVIWKIEKKEYLRYYVLNVTKILFFLLPISAIILAFVATGDFINSGDTLEEGAEALGSMIGGGIVVVVSFIVGILGGVILHFVNKEPKCIKEEGFEEAMNIGVFILYIIVASLIWGIANTL